MEANPLIVEYRVLTDKGDGLICLVKYNLDGSKVLHIPDNEDYSHLVDFEQYLDEFYKDE